MRTSPQRNTLAVLRVLLGLGQKQMGELVGRSTRTIQAIELGQLKLGEDLANEIVGQTGISPAWLLRNDTTAPPVDVHGEPYSKFQFERNQAWLRRSMSGGDLASDGYWVSRQIQQTVRAFAGVALAAMESKRFALFDYKMSACLKSLAGEFGERGEAFQRPDTHAAGMELSKATTTWREDSVRVVQDLFQALDATLAGHNKRKTTKGKRKP